MLTSDVMKKLNSFPEHNAIHRQIIYLNRRLPSISETKHGHKVLWAAAALAICNRFLVSIDSDFHQRQADTSGPNLRTIYETWILGHLILLADDAELKEYWAISRGHAKGLADGLEITLDYPAEAPDAKGDPGVYARAVKLEQKLKTLRNDDWKLPVLCYNAIFRGESFIGAHVNLASIHRYIDKDTLTIVRPKEEDENWRTILAAIMVNYFAIEISKSAKLPIKVLKEIEATLKQGATTLGKDSDKDVD